MDFQKKNYLDIFFRHEFVMKICFFEILCYRRDSFEFCGIAHVKWRNILSEKPASTRDVKY